MVKVPAQTTAPVDVTRSFAGEVLLRLIEYMDVAFMVTAPVDNVPVVVVPVPGAKIPPALSVIAPPVVPVPPNVAPLATVTVPVAAMELPVINKLPALMEVAPV